MYKLNKTKIYNNCTQFLQIFKTNIINNITITMRCQTGTKYAEP